MKVEKYNPWGSNRMSTVYVSLSIELCHAAVKSGKKQTHTQTQQLLQPPLSMRAQG